MWGVIFPGQGSQAGGMGRFYYDNFKTAQEMFHTAGDIAKINFKKLCFEGPESTLTLTQNAQPAIVLNSCAAWACLSKELDLSFIKYGAGHSVGEYSAVTAGGGLSFAENLQAVLKRSLFMAELCTPGRGG